MFRHLRFFLPSTSTSVRRSPGRVRRRPDSVREPPSRCCRRRTGRRYTGSLGRTHDEPQAAVPTLAASVARVPARAAARRPPVHWGMCTV